MSVVSAYQIVRLRPFRVNTDTSRSFDFDIPGSLDEAHTAFVSFLIISSEDLRLSLAIDGRTVHRGKYAEGPERCVHRSVGRLAPTPLRKRMNVDVTRGKAHLTDVVLWFRRRVDVADTSTEAIVADYRVARAEPFRMSVGAVTIRTFDVGLPQAIRAVTSNPMILTFLVVSSDDLHMTVSIDDVVVSDRLYTTGAERCIQEIAADVPVTTLQKGVTFTVVRGEVMVSDVVLWFQRAADFDNVVTG